MKKFLVLSMIAILALNSCTLLDTGSVRDQPEIGKADFNLAREHVVLLADSLFAGNASQGSITVQKLGSRGTARFTNLDLAQVRYPSGESILERNALTLAAEKLPTGYTGSGGFIFTGFINQGDGRHLESRIMVDGTAFQQSFLLEFNIDRVTGKWTARVNGERYK
ncbi:MAG: hypothetical protein AB9828_08050 [Sphaerochaetaceae bacterium]